MSTPRPRFSFSLRSLTPQLFGFVILPLTLLLMVIAFGGLNLHQQAMRTLVGERDLRAVQSISLTLGEKINHRITALQTLAMLVAEEMLEDDLLALIESPAILLPDFDGGLAFVARGGEVITFKGDASFWQNFSSFDGAAERFRRDVPDRFIEGTHPISGKPITLVTATSYKGGPIAVGAFSPGALAQQALDGVFVANDRSTAFIVDEESGLLYQAGEFYKKDETAATHAGVAEALAGESGSIFIHVDGNEHVIAYSQVQPVGWALVIEEPWEDVASPLLRTTENLPLILVPALFLTILAIWFGIGQIVQPLHELGRKAAQVGWGNYKDIEEPVGGISEIRKLQTELIHLSRKVNTAQQGLRGYIGAMTTGQEEERRRLARELHDDTIQSLIALNQRVQLADLALREDPSSATLAEVKDLISQTLENLRRITRALRPIYLEELGLVTALETLAAETKELGQFDLAFKCIGTQRRLSPQVELALYRITQEASNNILRHAEAGRSEIALAFSENEVSITIEDDGKGFVVPESPSELVPQEHFGLLGLHERAELIGASLEIYSSPGQGTRIHVVVRQ